MTPRWKPMKSAPMKSAPRDGTLILLGLWVRNVNTGHEHWDIYPASFHDEDGDFVDQDNGGLPWGDEDFDAWQPLPPPPVKLKKGKK